MSMTNLTLKVFHHRNQTNLIINTMEVNDADKSMTLMFPMGGLPKPRSGEAATGPIVARRSLLRDAILSSVIC